MLNQIMFLLLRGRKKQSFDREPNSHYVSVGLSGLLYEVKQITYLGAYHNHNVSVGLTDYTIAVTQTGDNIL